MEGLQGLGALELTTRINGFRFGFYLINIYISIFNCKQSPVQLPSAGLLGRLFWTLGTFPSTAGHIFFTLKATLVFGGCFEELIND